MPNRILKESICTSENMDALSPMAECLWYRLLVQFDDFGRFDGRPVVILARCFPLRVDKIKAKDVAGWMSELIAARLIESYRVNGHDYIRAVTWDKHQKSPRLSPSIWREIRRRVFERDSFTCQYCGETNGPLQCDHVIPVSRGGSNEESNLVTACKKCNQAKHNKTPEEWLA